MSEFAPSLFSKVSSLSKRFRKIAVLKLWVDPNATGLREIYYEHVQQHNMRIITSSHPDSGFDVFVPYKTTLLPGMETSQMIKLAIKTEMCTYFSDDQSTEPTALHLIPRSSICKIPLMQSNHLGLIDMGYRGHVSVPVRNLLPTNQLIDQHARLFQLVHPLSCPILVEIMDKEEDLSITERGEGGFGSTGQGGAVCLQQLNP